MKIKQFVLLAVLSVWAMGCVAGNTMAFEYAAPATSTVGQGKTVVLLPVADERPYILEKDEPLTFVGEMRNGYGMPFNVNTANGRPFAEVVTSAVQRDLEAAGFTVVRGERAQGSNRALSVTMKEFMSNTSINIDVVWDFVVRVLDGSGNVVAEDADQGEQELKGSMMNPVKAAKKSVPEYFSTVVHRMITGNPKIVQALTSP